jgi:hypothetical protein
MDFLDASRVAIDLRGQPLLHSPASGESFI